MEEKCDRSNFVKDTQRKQSLRTPSKIADTGNNGHMGRQDFVKYLIHQSSW